MFRELVVDRGIENMEEVLIELNKLRLKRKKISIYNIKTNKEDFLYKLIYTFLIIKLIVL